MKNNTGKKYIYKNHVLKSKLIFCYSEWGWKIFEAFETYTKLEGGGYAALKDVTKLPAPKDNRMDTFFLAETLKYLYLLFSPDDIIPLEGYVFNTEAHPLPVFSPTI